MATTPRLRVKRGAFTSVPTTGMLAGELHHTTDRGTIEVATGATTKMTVVPAVETLTDLASGLDMDNDFFLLHDASQAGQKEKKMKPSVLKAALNIPEASTDEKVAAASGATAGYLDAVLVTTSSVKISRPEVESVLQDYLIAEVDVIDCGTF